MEKLGIDIKLLTAQGVNFLIFFYIFKKYLAKPFLKFLNEQKEKEKEKLKLEEEINQKKEAFLEEEKKKREELKKELGLVREEAKREMTEEKEKIIIQAKRQAEIIKEKAKKEIEMERLRLETELRKKVSEVALTLIKKGLKDLLTTEVEKELTRNIIKNSRLKIN